MTFILSDQDQAEAARFERERALRRARALLKAQPIPAAEWPGEVWREETDDAVFDSIEAWRQAEFDRLWPREAAGDEAAIIAATEALMPAWIWATQTDTWTPSIDHILDAIAESADDEAFDEARYQIDFAPLRTFLEDWAPKQVLNVLREDRSRVIVLDQARYEAEMAAARELVGWAG